MPKHMAERNFKKRKSQNVKKKPLNTILLIILILLFIYSAINVVFWAVSNIGQKKQETEVAKQVETVKKDEEGEEVQSIDFGKLKEINQDSVAWIKISNTNINYPIMQANDNEYYLKKDIYKKYSSCGSIFMDYRNNKQFTDKNTVIFGHNLTLGMMFSDLQQILKGKLGNDVYVDIYMENKIKQYKVFSCYQTEPVEDPISVNISNYKEFLDNALKNSQIDFKTNPNEQDNIITLSTCDNTGKERIIVHAVAILEKTIS